MKSNLLHAIPPIAALIALLALWIGNRSAAEELEKLAASHRSLKTNISHQRSHREPDLAFQARLVTPEPETIEATPSEQALPPLVVPGTMAELGHALAAMKLKEIELSNGEYGDPAPGTAEFDAMVKELQAMMGSITPITAGIQVLAESLQDPFESGECLAVIVSDLVGLNAAETDVIAERLGQLRKRYAAGGDADSLSSHFFEESRDILSDSEAEMLKKHLGADFPAMPVRGFGF